jgi:acyl carrier protein
MEYEAKPKSDKRAEPKSDKRAETLLQVIGDLLTEIHPHHPHVERITLDSSFEKELGLDSLSRVELIARVETAFKLALPERTYAEAETPRDLLRTLLGTEVPYAHLPASEISAVALGEAAVAPAEAQTLVDILRWHVAQHPDRPHIQLYQDDGKCSTASRPPPYPTLPGRRKRGGHHLHRT